MDQSGTCGRRTEEPWLRRAPSCPVSCQVGTARVGFPASALLAPAVLPTPAEVPQVPPSPGPRLGVRLGWLPGATGSLLRSDRLKSQVHRDWHGRNWAPRRCLPP